MISNTASLRVVLYALAGNSLVTIAKIGGWLISASPSMLAESIHSLADTANQCFLFLGIRFSSGRPNREYPWGRGQARYVWNLISAVGIFFIGFGITTYNGIEALFRPTDASHSGGRWISLAILVISFCIEFWTFNVARKEVWKRKGEAPLLNFIFHGDDPTGVAVLLEDFVALLGVGLAFFGVLISKLTGDHSADAIASILIGCLLGILAVVLALANGRLLMGAATTRDREEEIKRFVESHPCVEKVISLKTEVLSPHRVRLSMEVEFHGEVMIDRQLIERDADRIRMGDEPVPILVETAARTVRQVGREINKLEAAVQRKFSEIVAIDLEVN